MLKVVRTLKSMINMDIKCWKKHHITSVLLLVMSTTFMLCACCIATDPAICELVLNHPELAKVVIFGLLLSSLGIAFTHRQLIHKLNIFKTLHAIALCLLMCAASLICIELVASYDCAIVLSFTQLIIRLYCTYSILMSVIVGTRTVMYYAIDYMSKW